MKNQWENPNINELGVEETKKGAPATCNIDNRACKRPKIGEYCKRVSNAWNKVKCQGVSGGGDVPGDPTEGDS